MPIFVASTTVFDIETQPTVTIPLPPPAPTTARAPPPPPPHSISCCALDEFFGYDTRQSRTHDSSITAVEARPPPPPYAREDKPPMYELKAPEPVTLAEYLFKFGFLFPPFWILGAWILWSPLRAPEYGSGSESRWMPDKTEEERQRVVLEMRKAEVRWALRCLWALLILVQLGAIAGAACWIVLHS